MKVTSALPTPRLRATLCYPASLIVNSLMKPTNPDRVRRLWSLRPSYHDSDELNPLTGLHTTVSSEFAILSCMRSNFSRMMKTSHSVESESIEIPIDLDAGKQIRREVSIQGVNAKRREPVILPHLPPTLHALTTARVSPRSPQAFCTPSLRHRRLCRTILTRSRVEVLWGR